MKQRKNEKDTVALASQVLVDACKILFANIGLSQVDEKISTICITSSHMAEGKSTTALNLAIAIAQSGKKTLLVENDMRKRSLSRALRVSCEHDICDLIRGAIPIESAVVKTGFENLYFLDAAPGVPVPSDILESNRYSRLVLRLKERFDFVIFDTPPALLFVDASIVANLVDGTVFVVKEGSTKKTSVTKALSQLQKANCNIIGLVMTSCKIRKDDYYYYDYYYSDDGNVGTKKKSSVNIDWSEIERAEKPVWDVDPPAEHGKQEPVSIPIPYELGMDTPGEKGVR